MKLRLWSPSRKTKGAKDDFLVTTTTTTDEWLDEVESRISRAQSQRSRGSITTVSSSDKHHHRRRSSKKKELVCPPKSVSTNHGSNSSALSLLLADCLPGMVVDPDDGMAAMLAAVHLPMAALGQATMAQLVAVWADPEFGLQAMIRDLCLPEEGRDDTTTRSIQQDANLLMDTVLAHMLQAYYKAQQAAAELPELVSPTIVDKSVDEDVSMTAMFREVAQLLGLSDQEVNNYMNRRLESVTEEAAAKQRRDPQQMFRSEYSGCTTPS